jgi:hypothetical protein
MERSNQICLVTPVALMTWACLRSRRPPCPVDLGQDSSSAPVQPFDASASSARFERVTLDGGVGAVPLGVYQTVNYNGVILSVR